MTPENFCYWLQGLLELGSPVTLDAAQTAMIKRHLETVFVNVTAPKAAPISPVKDLGGATTSWIGGGGMGVQLC